jgi:hypothetical protein
LDVLNSFHETMEAIVRPASLLQGSDLDEARLGSLRALAAAADREWSLVEKTAFPWQDYGISAERAQRFAGLVGAERAAIDALQEALAAQDSARILTAARALKPAFAKTYMFFGAIDDSK